MSGILVYRRTSVILYYDTLHGFRAGQGTGTASLKAKMLHQLESIREEVIYDIFLDLHKAYGSLDRERCLDILLGYVVGPRSLHLFHWYSGHLVMVAI